VFGNQRNVQPSTHAPRQELLAETAHIMEKDSSLDPRQQPRHRGVRGNGYPEGNQQRSNHTEAKHNNLWHSPLNTMSGAQRPDNGPAVVDEDPSNLGRRHQEKNFSDIFGTQMAGRSQVGQRHEITGARTCSFLDTRSEIAARNQNNWRHDDEPHHRRKEAERGSNLFDRDTPAKPDYHPDHKQVHHHERTCWDTKDILQTGSEIARRVRMKDHHNEDAGDLQTAYDRKQDDLSSHQFHMGTGVPHSMVRQTSPRAYSPGSARLTAHCSQRGKERLNVTAKDMKIAALQSSIFT
jgi:hypothetical protein